MFPIIIYCKPGLIKEWKISEKIMVIDSLIIIPCLILNPLSDTESQIR